MEYRSSSTRSSSGFDLSPPDADRRRELEAALTPEQRHVLLQHGTEAPFCGAWLDNKEPGTYCCGLCGLPLFRSGQKFKSGTGWPSFTAPFNESHLQFSQDSSFGMERTEILCARCGSHLGHVFPDGPPPTGLRFCINSVSLEFISQDLPLPDKLDRSEGVRHGG